MSCPYFSLRKLPSLFVASTFSLLILPSAAIAQHFHADVGVGGVVPADSDFDAGYAFDHAIAYQYSYAIVRLGGVFLGGLEPDGASESAEVDIGGLYLNVGGVIDLKPVTIELSGGVLFSETRADFMGRRIVEERDESPFVAIKLATQLTRVVSLQADWKYIEDVTGGDLNVITAGVRFSF